MTAAPLHVAGARLMLDPGGALAWPEAGLLAVADLHLEKGSAAAARGRMLPPWDTRATLDRLALLLRRWRPRLVLALGDSFHDRDGPSRLLPADAERLRALTGGTRFIWLRGNHDPAPPEGLGGEAAEEWRQDGIVFRHVPDLARRSRAAGAEIAGHLHPKASVATRGGTLTRPCFVADARRVVLPAFGAYTGGLDVRDVAISGLFPRGGRVFLLGRERLFSFPLGGAVASEESGLPEGRADAGRLRG